MLFGKVDLLIRVYGEIVELDGGFTAGIVLGEVSFVIASSIEGVVFPLAAADTSIPVEKDIALVWCFCSGECLHQGEDIFAVDFAITW